MNKNYTEIVIFFLFLKLISGNFHSREILLHVRVSELCETWHACSASRVLPYWAVVFSIIKTNPNTFTTTTTVLTVCSKYIPSFK